MSTLTLPNPPAQQLPSFSLPDFDGKIVSSPDLASDVGTLVVFMCNHCPYVQHVADQLSLLGRDLAEFGLTMVGINSNDPVAYPDDDADHMRETAARHGYTFPYLVDVDQDVARAFGALCTPDVFLYDAAGRLYYRGQLDGSRPGGTEPVTGRDLRAAVDRLRAGEPAPADQRPSVGCSIKWTQTDAKDNA
ncbi:thioredoxin family protein [Streptomyces sp. NPDC058459]|uniref:thioredoxin family protein n=1 Tax=Streptomyces sp. NPDC058459 TaxID=3346508 RepID=UPI003660D093